MCSRVAARLLEAGWRTDTDQGRVPQNWGQASTQFPPRVPPKNSQRQVPPLAHSSFGRAFVTDEPSTVTLPASLSTLQLLSFVDVAVSQTATMLYEMIGIVSETILPRLGKHRTRSLRTILLTRRCAAAGTTRQPRRGQRVCAPCPVPPDPNDKNENATNETEPLPMTRRLT